MLPKSQLEGQLFIHRKFLTDIAKMIGRRERERERERPAEVDKSIVELSPVNCIIRGNLTNEMHPGFK